MKENKEQGLTAQERGVALATYDVGSGGVVPRDVVLLLIQGWIHTGHEEVESQEVV